MGTTQSKASLLIVDDEEDICLSLVEVFKKTYDVRSAPNAIEAMQLIHISPPNLIVLDIHLAGKDGVELCREIRSVERYKNIPIIMITGRDEKRVRIDAFQSGADDYITKPFHLDELRARIESRIIRLQSLVVQKVPIRQVGRLTVDGTRMKAFVDDIPVELGTIEFRILLLLADEFGQLVIRQSLEDTIWGHERPLTRSLDAHISALRKKILNSGVAIRTIYGRGFVMEALTSSHYSKSC